MEQSDYYLYINGSKSLGIVKNEPVQTAGGVEEYFSNRGIIDYWAFNQSDRPSFIDAVIKAVKNGADFNESVKILKNYSISYDQIRSFAEDKGIDIEEIGDKYEIGDGEVTSDDDEAIRGLLSYYSSGIKTKKSKSEEE